VEVSDERLEVSNDADVEGDETPDESKGNQDDLRKGGYRGLQGVTYQGRLLSVCNCMMLKFQALIREWSGSFNEDRMPWLCRRAESGVAQRDRIRSRTA